MELMTAILLGSFIVILLWWMKEYKDGNKNLPPGSFGLPIIGETLQFLLEVRQA